MRVLITNDDGVLADGIRVLAECAAEVFDEVLVVAPDSERSAISQAISLHHPLRVEELEPGRWSVSGTPVDSVFIALGHLLADARPDLVLSGINHGPNVGFDVYYSGTVGAAREALVHGVPSVALSLSARGTDALDGLRPAIIDVLALIRDTGVPAETLLNVNFPTPRPDVWPDARWAGVPGLRGLRVTDLGRRYYGNEVIYREDPRGRPYYWIGGAFPRLEEREGTDCDVLANGYVSLTPIGLDATRRAAFPALAPFHQDG
ncbi:MAG: 5'/3'-nucleotidase SurE [Deltaproteobacteria bacterium]|nr:MAG: 5'/3'-nucleotidase SurE [Deltaproteobacteria bacterium]